MTSKNKKFLLCAICAAISMYSFININSAISDKYNLRLLFQISGVVFAIGAVYFLATFNKKEGS